MFRRIRVFWWQYAAVCKHRSRMGRLDRSKRNADRKFEASKSKRKSWWRECVIALAVIGLIVCLFFRAPELSFQVVIRKLKHDLFDTEIAWGTAIGMVLQSLMEQLIDIIYLDSEIEELFDENMS